MWVLAEGSLTIATAVRAVVAASSYSSYVLTQAAEAKMVAKRGKRSKLIFVRTVCR